MSMIKISIIVPVYNREAYLEKCIRSVFSQSLQEIEIICVDDGSTDSSSRIIQSLAAEDSRLRYLWQENQGAGKARNLGLKQAQGKYVCFLDADDYYMNENALEAMFNGCEKHAVSVCACQRMCIWDSEECLYERELFSPQNAGRVLDYRDCQTDYYYQNYLFQRKLLVENEIFFPFYLRYQDPPFLVRAAYTAGRLLILDMCMYCYRASDTSICFSVKKAADMMRGVIDNLLFARDHQLDTLFHNTAERLETDLAYLIYENLSPGDLEILKLLMQANQLVCDEYGISNYVIKPLRLILFSAEHYEQELLDKIRAEEKIALYGAGNIAKAFLHYLKGKNLLCKVTCIVVSDLAGNPAQIEGIPVISLQSFLKEKDVFLLVTVSRAFAEEMVSSLRENRYSRYDVMDDIFGDILIKKAKERMNEDNCHCTGL